MTGKFILFTVFVARSSFTLVPEDWSSLGSTEHFLERKVQELSAFYPGLGQTVPRKTEGLPQLPCAGVRKKIPLSQQAQKE
jgi:hypothetical protein